MAPTQQRLDAGDAAAEEISLRLIVEQQFVALEGMPKAGFKD
jgi:hypothetical protein